MNVNRKPGARLVHPSDFIKERPRPEDFMSIDEAIRTMDSWADEQTKLAQGGEQ